MLIFKAYIPNVSRYPFASLVCLVLATLWCGAAPGAVMHKLYEAEVPVDDQGEQQRAQAVHTAMNQVLIKVTGDSEITTNPKVDDLLGHAQKYVQRFSYRTVAGTPSGEDPQSAIPQQMLLVHFDPVAIMHFLREAGIPVWGQTRPTVLVWLAVEQDGERYMVAGDREQDLQHQILQEAARRGVRVFLPLYDLQDQQVLGVADVWGNFQQVIAQASQRYGADAVVVGRVYRHASQDWRARWTLYEGRNSSSWQDDGGDVSDVVGQGVDGLADTLAQQFAQVISETVEGSVGLKVTGVSSVEDYARVTKYLAGLDLVSRVEVERVTGDSVFMQLALLGDAKRLAQHIRLGTTLEQVPTVPGTPVAAKDNPLVYRLLP